jgi:hypothetical protein
MYGSLVLLPLKCRYNAIPIRNHGIVSAIKKKLSKNAILARLKIDASSINVMTVKLKYVMVSGKLSRLQKKRRPAKK